MKSIKMMEEAEQVPLSNFYCYQTKCSKDGRNDPISNYHFRLCHFVTRYQPLVKRCSAKESHLKSSKKDVILKCRSGELKQDNTAGNAENKLLVN